MFPRCTVVVGGRRGRTKGGGTKRACNDVLLRLEIDERLEEALARDCNLFAPGIEVRSSRALVSSPLSLLFFSFVRLLAYLE